MSLVRSVTHVSGLNTAEGGGAGGIRTLDRPLQAYNGLANRRLQPLGHSSLSADMPDAGASRKRQIQFAPERYGNVGATRAFCAKRRCPSRLFGRSLAGDWPPRLSKSPKIDSTPSGCRLDSARPRFPDRGGQSFGMACSAPRNSARRKRSEFPGYRAFGLCSRTARGRSARRRLCQDIMGLVR